MEFKATSPDIRKNEKTGSNIPDLTSKKPEKLVSAKRANTGKLNLHLVSSTPMNPAKRAKFFDESNQFGSPIRSGGSSSDSPDNIIKLPESEKKSKKTMIGDEQAGGASPFPYASKLDVKKMTICGSDVYSDEDDMFKMTKGTKSKKKLMLDIDDDLNSSDSEEIIFDEETNDDIVKNLTKVLQDKVDTEPTKKVLKPTKKSTKSSDEDKENVNIKTNKSKPITQSPETKTKLKPVKQSPERNTKLKPVKQSPERNTKLRPVRQSPEKNTKLKSVTQSPEKNTKLKPVRQSPEKNTKLKSVTQSPEKNTKLKTSENKDDPKLDVSSKQRKLNENTVQRKRITKNENNDINSVAASKVSNRKLTITNNDTKIKTAENSRKVPNNRARQSSRSCAYAMPYWMAPFNINGIDETEVPTRTRSEEMINNTIKSVEATKRPNTVPETVTKRKLAKKEETKLENTESLNRTKSKLKSEPNKSDIKKELNETKNLTLNKSKTRNKPESEKVNLKQETMSENVKNVSFNRPKTKIKTNESVTNTSLSDKVPETAKILNISKTKKVEKKPKESQRNVLKSNENGQDIQLKETASNVKNIKNREFSKEILDKENKEKKNKVENIVSKLKLVSPKKSNLRDSLRQSVLENEVFEPIPEMDPEELRTIVKESIINKHKSVREDVSELFEVYSPPRISKRLTEKNKKDTNKIQYTPGVALKQNKKEAKSTKQKAPDTEKKLKNKMESRTLRSNTLNSKKSNSYVEFENDELVTSNSESTNDNQQQTTRKRRVVVTEKPVKNKIRIQTPGVVRKQYSNKSSKQVNFNVNNSEMNHSFESDSLSSYENPSKVSCKASYNYITNPSRQLNRSRDSRYPRRTLFYKNARIDGAHRSYRKPRYILNESTVDDSDDSWLSEDVYVPKTKRRKYMVRRENSKRQVNSAGFLNFKERAIAIQVPAVRQTLTEIQFRGKVLKMECFGSFPKVMTKISNESSSRGTCFMNEMFASGMMEIAIGTIKKCNASNNHTYFLVLDGMAEIGIADTVKIMRIGDCCVVPKHTFYYIANASSDVNLLLNFLKISI